MKEPIIEENGIADKAGLLGLVSFPVEVLGPGKRLGLWFQGCHRRCPGCISPHSRDFDPAFQVSFEDVEKKIKFYKMFTDKLTISGGEPFDQPDFLKATLRWARESSYCDIFVYSGYLVEELQEKFPSHLDLIDLLIDGQFLQDNPTTLVWRGSSNQRMHILSKNEKVIETYKPFLTMEEAKPTVQIVQKENRTYVVGIPRENPYASS